MASPHESSDLRRTAQEQMARGHTGEDIKAAMEKAGYQTDAINLALSGASGDKPRGAAGWGNCHGSS
ncbi:MAG: hypothetical protein JXB14_03245 [Candidatus Altiarchaeota archaeon]|nr:hypothetical protein [Candidatus Altiarchaeota archaeon]